VRKLEEGILHEAITGNHEVIASLCSDYFSSQDLRIICEAITEADTQFGLVTMDKVRSVINQSKLDIKGPILDVLAKMDGEMYGYHSSDLDTIRASWIARRAKHIGLKLQQAGTDQCTSEDVTKYVTELYQIVLEGQTEDAVDFSIEQDKLANRQEDDLKDTRLYLHHNLLIKVMGIYLMRRLYVLSGFSSSGKNIIADNLVLDLIKYYKGVYYSFDNSAEETVMSLTSVLHRIPYQHIESGCMNDTERQLIRDAKKTGNLTIVTKKMTAKQIRADLERRKKNSDLKFFVLDYFTNLVIPQKDTVRQFEDAAIQFKNICNDLNMTAIILSQVNDLGELKWCKGLFQEAYHVTRLDGERESNERDWSIQKYKKGALHTTKIKFDGSIGLIGDVNEGSYNPPNKVNDRPGDANAKGFSDCAQSLFDGEVTPTPVRFRV